MARREQPTQTDLQTFLIASERSNWVKDLRSLLRARETVDTVRILGRRDFFYSLIANLFTVYGVKVLNSDDDDAGRQTLSIITNPKIEERLDDMPSIITFFFQEKICLLRETDVADKDIPSYISGTFLSFLLRFPLWKDFSALQSYIHQAVVLSFGEQAINLDEVGPRLAHILAIGHEPITYTNFHPRTNYVPVDEHDYEPDNEWEAACYHFTNNNYLWSDAIGIYIERTSPNVSKERLFGEERLFGIDYLHRTCKAIQLLSNLDLPNEEIDRIQKLDWQGEDVVTPLESLIPDLTITERDSIYSKWREVCHRLGVHLRELEVSESISHKADTVLCQSGETLEFRHSPDFLTVVLAGELLSPSRNQSVFLHHIANAHYGVRFREISGLNPSPDSAYAIFRTSKAGKMIWNRVIDHKTKGLYRFKSCVKFVKDSNLSPDLQNSRDKLS